MHFITRIRKVYGESGGFKLCCAVNGFGAFSSRTIFAHVEPSSEKNYQVETRRSVGACNYWKISSFRKIEIELIKNSIDQTAGKGLSEKINRRIVSLI